MCSSAAISLDERCWSTSRRQSSWPALSRATRLASIDSDCAGSCDPAAASVTRAPPKRNSTLTRKCGRVCSDLGQNGPNRHISITKVKFFGRHWGDSFPPAKRDCGADGGGEGWIRTSVRLRGQIYSLL